MFHADKKCGISDESAQISKINFEVIKCEEFATLLKMPIDQDFQNKVTPFRTGNEGIPRTQIS